MGNAAVGLRQGVQAGPSLTSVTGESSDVAAQHAISARQSQLYAEYRFDREELVAALDRAVDDIKRGRSPAAMAALLGLVNPLGLGLALVESVRDHLIDKACEAAAAEGGAS